MSTYTQIFYHIIFATKDREPVLDKPKRDDLYRFVWGVLDKRKCHLYRIGGVDDHMQYLHKHPSDGGIIGPREGDQDSASSWIKGQKVFPRFMHWQDGYGAFTHSLADKERLIEYIKSQEEHHKKVTFREEFEALLAETGLKPDEHDEAWFDD